MLRELLSKDMKKLAGATYYARGKEYFEQGLVSSLEENDDEITACVEGTHDYEVRFWEEGGELCYECSCPVGQDYDFCKPLNASRRCFPEGLPIRHWSRRILRAAFPLLSPRTLPSQQPAPHVRPKSRLTAHLPLPECLRQRSASHGNRYIRA